MSKPTEDFDDEVMHYDANTIIRDVRKMEAKDDKKTFVSEKAKEQFRRMPNYGTPKCYKFPDVVCSKKCMLFNDCTRKGGK